MAIFNTNKNNVMNKRIMSMGFRATWKISFKIIKPVLAILGVILTTHAMIQSIIYLAPNKRNAPRRYIPTHKYMKPCRSLYPTYGPIPVNTSSTTIEEVETLVEDSVSGGHWVPSNCSPNESVAIIVPYRLREDHLAIWLRHMHSFLQKQQLDYTIFIVEQFAKDRFNRAMLLNVGYLEASKIHPYSCYIYHDVDMLPEDTRNLYKIPEQPRHMSVATSRLDYKLPYPAYFGGVVAFSSEQFKKVNGFSNEYWGWGGEDDDMSNRLKYHGFNISRYEEYIGRYVTLPHRRIVGRPNRFKNLRAGRKRFLSDGINSCDYTILNYEEKKLYTWIHVELNEPL